MENKPNLFVRGVIITSGALIVVGATELLTFWLHSKETFIQTSQREFVQLQSKTIPEDWKTYRHKKWSIRYPPSIDPRTLPITSIEDESIFFPIRSHGKVIASIEIRFWNISSSPFGDTIKALRETEGSPIDAMLFISHRALQDVDVLREELGEVRGESRIILDRLITIKGLRGGQFGYAEPGGDITLKTFLEKDDVIYELTLLSNNVSQEKSFDTYETMLSSFEF